MSEVGNNDARSPQTRTGGSVERDDVPLWESALKQITAKIEIMNDEFTERYDYNPIEHIKSRLKSAESIVTGS